MKSYLLGFIGTGNMGGALVRAACKKNAENVLIYNRTPARAQALAAQCGCTVAESAAEIAENAQFIVLGVKPAQVEDVLSSIRPQLEARKDAFLVSMAAGVSLEKLSSFCPLPCIRIMPNTPCAVGEGLTLVCADSRVSREALDRFKDALSLSGMLDEVEEKLFDSAGTVSGCGPAWAYMFIEALSDGAVACGVPRAKAMLYAAQMLRGAAANALASGQHPGALKDAVCSPGGSTIEGVAALENGAFRASVIEAVRASYEKTVEMGKK